MKTSRATQQWILDEFLKVEDVFSYRFNFLLEWGFKHADLRRTVDRIRAFAMIPKEWGRTARQREAAAQRAESEGRYVTAAADYHRAALYYGQAQSLTYENDESKVMLHGKLLECYRKFIALSGMRVERVEIPFEGKRTIPGVLHLPDVAGNAPCVIVCPGMDTFKESFPNPYDNHFARRGMAALTIDGPGQGECNLREQWVTVDNYDRAGQAAVTYLQGRSEIDPARIGLFGWSMGSYWALRIAAAEPRLKGAVAVMPCFMEKGTIFNRARPHYKENFMYMAGMTDEAAFDAMAEQMTMEGLERKIQCPVLIGTGEYDELCSLKDTDRMFNALRCPKELWVYENQFHSMAGVLSYFYHDSADWLLRAVNGKISHDLNRRVVFPPD